jgi:hypothetical protein
MSYNPYSRELGQKVKLQLAQQMATAETNPQKKVERIKYLMNTLATPCPGFLRSEVSLDSPTAGGIALQSIQFPILVQDAPTNNPWSVQTMATENRLRVADVFFCTVWRLAIGVFKLNTSSPYYSAANQALETLYTNPNPIVFSTTNGYNAGGVNTNVMNNLYNGKLSVRIDTTTYYDSYPVMDFRRVDTAQQGALGINAALSTTLTNPFQLDNWNGPWYGAVPLGESGFAVSGTSTNIIKLDTPNPTIMGITNLGTGTYGTNVVLQLGGFLFQNASSLNKQ